MSEWQEIETAPKDGTIIRAKNEVWAEYCCQTVMRARFVHGAWQAVPMGLTLSGKEVPDPTHWQPIPDRPKS